MRRILKKPHQKAVYLLAAFTLLHCQLAFASISTTLTISSSSHPDSSSSTNSDISLSWNAQNSDDNASITYDYILSQTASHDLTSFQGQWDDNNTSILKTGTKTDATTHQFLSVVDGTFYFHLLAYDGDGPVNGTGPTTYGPIVLNTVPTLAVSPISPATGTHISAISVTITGSKFITGASVELVNGMRGATALADVPLTGEVVASATSITATVPIDTVPGTYDLKVTNGGPHGQQVSSVDAYQSTNTLPTANAGPDQTLTLSSGTATLNLDGTGSSDSDGDSPLTYSWTTDTKPASSTVAATFSGSTKTLTLNYAGTYVFSLIVNDGFQNSVADTVTVTVNSTSNNPPTANAGVDQIVVPGAQVTLNGALSSDPDTDPLTYEWAISSKPLNSTLSTGSASINQTATTDTTATFTPDWPGTYVVSLTVNDGTVDSSADTVSITANTRPVANAGTDSSAAISYSKQLDGTGSYDDDNDTLTYAWTIVDEPVGSGVTLSSATASQPTFTPTHAGDYIFGLTVNDGTQNSLTSDNVTITAVTGFTVTHDYKVGWNLVPLSVDGVYSTSTELETAIESNNPGVTVIRILGWNKTSQTFDVHQGALTFNLTVGNSYFVLISGGSGSLTLAGPSYSSTNIVTGFSFLGIEPQADGVLVTSTDLESKLETQAGSAVITRILGWDNTNQIFRIHQGALTFNLDVLVDGVIILSTGDLTYTP